MIYDLTGEQPLMAVMCDHSPVKVLLQKPCDSYLRNNTVISTGKVLMPNDCFE